MSQDTRESSESTEVDKFLPNNLSLPAYVPLSPNLRRDFERVFRVTANDLTTPAINQHRSTTKSYIHYILENGTLDFDEQTLNNFAIGYKQLLESRCNLKKFESVASDDRITNYLNKSQPLTLETLDSYHSMEKPSYEELMSQPQAITSTTEVENHLESDEFYQLLRSILFVLKHPEEPVPDVTADDEEDVGISGGTISLKDPLTLNTFTSPVMGSCGHTFESLSIRQQIQQHPNGVIECPISGCDNQLLMNNLKQDILMKVRVRIASKQHKSNDDLDIVH